MKEFNIKLKLITPQDITGPWALFYDVFAKTHKYPRFYQSPLYLLQGGKTFLWAIHNECLVIVKRKHYMGLTARGLALMLPPIHAEGNPRKEHEVMDYLLSQGFSVHISEEDVTRYGLSDTCDSKYGGEIIYRAGDMVEMMGSQYARDRWYARKLDAAVASGDITIKEVHRPPNVALDILMKQCREVTLKWVYDKKEKGVDHLGRPESYAKHFPRLLGENVLHVFFNKRTPCAYTMVERISDNKAILSIRYHDNALAHLLFGQVSRVMHITDLRTWSNIIGPDGLLSIGVGGVATGLTAAKRELHPVHELQMGKIKGAPITDQIWGATVPEQEPEQSKQKLAGFSIFKK